MVEHKVLITTSGLGTRLGNLTNNTNKCLVRITDKPAISHIIESYPENTEFVITLGYYGDYVKQFLQLTYPNHNFTFVNVDKYEGEGSSLGYSILQCKDVIDKPFIFHASDTILTNTTLPNLDHNWMAGSFKEDASHYRTIVTRYGNIGNVYDKGEINYDSLYIGISGIKDYELFFETLEWLVNNSNEDLSDVHVILKMLNKTNFKHFFVPLDYWFDVGNVSELNRTRASFKSNINVLDKSEESIFFFDDFVIKFFSNSSINKNRVARGKLLNGLVPEILGHTENFYKYKKAEGNLFSKSVNVLTFKNLLEWAKDSLWQPRENKNIKQACHSFYISKTKDRISKYLNNSQDKEIYINGELVPNIHNLLNKVDEDWLTDGIPTQFHGDFILDNIIETKDGFSLIDWRQDFGDYLDFGDIYYDLAKLNHNLTVNHEIVDKGLFNKDKNNCYILTNSTLNDCGKVLKKFCEVNGYDYKKVQILTCIIWLNMAALHEYPFNDFLFTFGKYKLYLTLNEWNIL